MSSPLDSTFPTSLTAAPRGNLGCALSDSLQFFDSEGNWLCKSKANSIQLQIAMHQEVKKVSKVQSSKFKTQRKF